MQSRYIFVWYYVLNDIAIPELIIKIFPCQDKEK